MYFFSFYLFTKLVYCDLLNQLFCKEQYSVHKKLWSVLNFVTFTNKDSSVKLCFILLQN